GNAIKFTDRGGVSIVVEPASGANDIVIKVHDTGIGIAGGQQSRIFGEFEQADGGSTRKFAGTGLGLAISRRIVERMGGRIGVESAPGAGATFHVTVPLPSAADVGAPDFSPPNLADLEAMIVAPSAVEATLVARRLAQWGARTCVVPDAKVAATLLREQTWNVIFVDHTLGRDACECLADA